MMNHSNPALRRPVLISAGLMICLLIASCASKEKQDRDFHTSGSRDADQRAEQRVAKTQQMRGQSADGEGRGAVAKYTLFERLGGEKGVRAISDDFVRRAMADPRVNWQRNGVKRGGVLGIGGKEEQWNPTGENVAKLAKHLAQFISVASGGPSKYEGRNMVEVHKGMKITNAEFDASIGDMKATLEFLGVGTNEQKELLAIIESTRPQIAEER